MTDPWGTWTNNPQAYQVFGDQGPWVRHLALAWHAANLPAGLDVPLPADPTNEFTRCKHGGDAEDYSRLHGDTLAYWTPLLHLVCFGLGWTRPDLGLMRWMECGGATEDPILRLVDRWWGQERLLDFLAWAATTPALMNFGRQIAATGNHRRFTEDRLPDSYADRRQERTWQAVWGVGGGDPLQLIDHCVTPMTYPGEGDGIEFDPVPHWGDAHTSTNAFATPRMVIVSKTYRAWYALFWHYRPERGGNGRSIRTDFVCTPVGWLGEYRFSTVTGAWFRGRHRWHELGN